VPAPNFRVEGGLEGMLHFRGPGCGKWCDCFALRERDLLSRRVTEIGRGHDWRGRVAKMARCWQ